MSKESLVLKNGDINQNFIEALLSLGEIELPIPTSFTISKAIHTIREQAKIIDENRNKLYKKYGEKTDNGQIRIIPENMKVFMEDMQELDAIDVELKMEKIKLELKMLETQGVKVKSNTLAVLTPILDVV